MNRKQWAAGVAFYLTVVPLIVCYITGCTSSPQGKSLDRSNYADIGSTGIALTVADATEANPLGVALIPIKLGMGWGLEQWTDNCYSRAEFAGITNSFYYGATANNLALAAGATAAPVVGLAGGVAYYLFKESVEPDTFECVPDVPALKLLAKAYADGDSSLLNDVFTADAVEAGMVGIERITQSYEAFFAKSDDRRMWFFNDEYLGAEIDGLWWFYRYEIEYTEGKISRFDYEEVSKDVVAAL